MEAVPEVGGAAVRTPMTARGSSDTAFTARDWALLLFVGLVFGSSFFFIEVGLTALSPPVIAFIRLALGYLTLSLFTRARDADLTREDGRRVAAIGLVWLAIPLMLFPVAQLWIDTSVAGMLNGAMPLMTVGWTVLLARTLPGRSQALGLSVWFVGIVAVALAEIPTGALGTRTTLLGAGLAAMAGTVALIVALIWMAVCLLRLAGTFRDIPGHLVRAGYILERSEASASDAPKTPPQDAGRFPPDAGLAAGAILADLPCVTCGTELRGCLISDGCSECSSPVEDSLLVLPQPDATRLAIRLAPWAILFWLFTTVTGPFSAAAAGLMLYCSHRLARRCELDRMPAMARPVGELWWAARVGLVVVVIFSLVDTPWYFSSENAQPIREHGAGRSLHLVGSLCVYIAGLGVTFWFLSVCRGLARRARRQSLATSFTVVKYLFLTGLAASWGALAARDLPGSYDHGRLLGYSSVGWHTVGELAGVPGGIWAVCVLVASIWLIVSAYRLSHALRDAPRDWSRVVRGDSEPHRPVRRYNTPRTREAGPE